MFFFSVCLLACLFVCLFVCYFATWFACLLVCLLVCLFACLLVCLFVCLFLCFFVCLFVCLFLCFFVCLFGFNMLHKHPGQLEELAPAQDLGGASAASGLRRAANLWLDIAAGWVLEALTKLDGKPIGKP